MQLIPLTGTETKNNREKAAAFSLFAFYDDLDILMKLKKPADIPMTDTADLTSA